MNTGVDNSDMAELEGSAETLALCPRATEVDTDVTSRELSDEAAHIFQVAVSMTTNGLVIHCRCLFS